MKTPNWYIKINPVPHVRKCESQQNLEAIFGLTLEDGPIFELMNSCFSSGETIQLLKDPGVNKVLYQIKAIVQEEYSATGITTMLPRKELFCVKKKSCYWGCVQSGSKVFSVLCFTPLGCCLFPYYYYCMLSGTRRLIILLKL